MAIEEMATDIVGRYRLDISFEAVVAAASLLWDSDSVNHRGFLGASANLLPFLLEARKGPASPLIAAAFPPVYRELQQGGVADFLSFAFIFLDWDRCKVARRQLVDAFVRSDWRPTDIALAAARAGDAERILAAVMQEAEGKRLIGEIERDLEFIPSPWRSQVGTAIREIREKKSRFH